MPIIDEVLHATQPGLAFTPTHGMFIIGWLRESATRDAVVAALRGIILGAEARADCAAVAAVSGAQWSAWTGSMPPGAPPSSPVIAGNPHFSASGGDVWVYLKALDDAGLDALVELADAALALLLRDEQRTRAMLPADGKILDDHFVDGITSPSDPATFVLDIVQNGTTGAPGSCWALVQKFVFAQVTFDDMTMTEQQNMIGRDNFAVLIPDEDVRSHIKRVRTMAQDHANRPLLRQALPFGHAAGNVGMERGLCFAAFAQTTELFETMVTRMIGGPEGDSDKLLAMINAVEGGYFYVPSAQELGLGTGLEPEDFEPAPLWQVRSANGLMFYNSADYLNIMGTGRYAMGDPPSQRILGLLGKVFDRWQNHWYRRQEIPRMNPLSDFLALGEEHYLTAPVPIRRGLSIQRMLTRVCTGTEYPVPHDSWAWHADVFRIDPEDILAGVMPDLSLGRGKEVMPYLNDDERLQGFLVMLDETSSMGHVVPKHAKFLEKGIAALLAELATLEAAATGDAKTFYTSARLSLEGVQGYCLNYALLAEHMIPDHAGNPGWQANLRALADRMRKLATDRPDTFVEAMQMIFTLHCCLHLVGEPVSVGRLDQLLLPYYNNGTSEAEAQEVLDAFWVKLGEKALHNRQHASDHVTYGTTSVSYVGGNFPQGDGINQWVQQVTVGGYLPNDDPTPTPGANHLTLLCLRSARRLPLNAPVLSLRVYPGMDDAIIEEAALALLSGGSHPILFNEERMVAALHTNSGLPLNAARDYVCDGCYEPMIAGQCEFAFSNIVTLDALEFTLNQGARFNQNGPVYLRGWKVSFRSPHAAEITTFEQFRELYIQHLRYLTVQFFNGVYGAYGSLWNYCPSPLLSIFIDGCMETGRDLSNGGTRYHLIAPMYLALSTAIDSLYAIKTLVYDAATAVTTLEELVMALHCDWGHAMIEPFQNVLAGAIRSEEQSQRYRWLRSKALALPRFGTGNAEVDAIGRWLVQTVCDTATTTLANPPEPLRTTLAGVTQKYSLTGVPWKPTLQVGVGTFEAYVGDALTSGASPDGRRNAQPFPSDFSPAPVPQDLPPIAQNPLAPGAVPGVNRPIYTSMSSWNMDAVNHGLSNAAPVDLNVREDFPLADMREFIRQYAAGNVGSNLITITVADPDTYHAAAAQPERYELVRVRMGGWTEYFSAMFPEHHAQHLRRPYFTPEVPPGQ